MKIFERAGMPRDRLTSQDLKVDPGAVPSFNDKAREHGDAGAVKEIQFPKIQHNRLGGSDQRFSEHLENGRIVRRAAEAQSAFENDGGVVLFSPNLKRFSIDCFSSGSSFNTFQQQERARGNQIAPRLHRLDVKAPVKLGVIISHYG